MKSRQIRTIFTSRNIIYISISHEILNQHTELQLKKNWTNIILLSYIEFQSYKVDCNSCCYGHCIGNEMLELSEWHNLPEKSGLILSEMLGFGIGLPYRNATNNLHFCSITPNEMIYCYTVIFESYWRCPIRILCSNRRS